MDTNKNINKDKNTNINEAILSVMKRVSYVEKTVRVKYDKTNYTAAGEADFIKAIREAMIDNGIIVRVIRSEPVDGSTFAKTLIKSDIEFLHVPSNTNVIVTAYGSGMDRGDKAVLKAQTVALKYAIRETFFLETGDDPDSTASEKLSEDEQKEEKKKQEAKIRIAKIKKALSDKAAEVGLMENPQDPVQLAAFKEVLGDVLDKIEDKDSLKTGIARINAWKDAIDTK